MDCVIANLCITFGVNLDGYRVSVNSRKEDELQKGTTPTFIDAEKYDMTVTNVG